MNLTPEQTNRLATNLLAAIKEQDRLRALSARQLIIEALSLDCSESPIVTELMDRLLPGWYETIPEEELA